VSSGASSGDQALNFIYLVGVLVLVASALMVRRVPMAKSLQMLAAWVLIFLAAFAVFALKDDFMALGRRVLAEGGGDGVVVQAGKELRVRKSSDGQFWVDAKVNGAPVHVLIDSGATTTSISTETARNAQIEPSGGFPVLVETANGPVQARRARIGRLVVGTIERRDFPVQVSESFGTMNVLGMNFLSSLSGWGVQGQWLVLKP
jgi:aspartyl protease family protein